MLGAGDWGQQPSKNMHTHIASVDVLYHKSWEVMSLCPNFCDKVHLWMCIVGKLLSIFFGGRGRFCQDGVLHTIFSQLKSALVSYSVSTIIVLVLPEIVSYSIHMILILANYKLQNSKIDIIYSQS